MALTNRFLRSLTYFPEQIFRVNFGRRVCLRELVCPDDAIGCYERVRLPRGPFDLLTEKGMVVPRALEREAYIFPNGASMRPNSTTMQNLARKVGDGVVVYGVAKGTQLPDHLILVHEFRDHFSLQARRGMTVDELNTHITGFLMRKSECFTRDQWLARYPRATWFWK